MNLMDEIKKQLLRHQSPILVAPINFTINIVLLLYIDTTIIQLWMDIRVV